MMRRVLVLSAALAACVLAGCTTGPSLKERMSAFVGKPEAELIKALGKPKKKIVIGSTAYFAYERTKYGVVPGSIGGPLFVDQRPVPYGFTPTVSPKYLFNICTTTFAIKGGVVQSFTMRGNDC